jgi:hypothetical protein
VSGKVSHLAFTIDSDLSITKLILANEMVARTLKNAIKKGYKTPLSQI